MYRIKHENGTIIADVPHLQPIKFNLRNKMPISCDIREMEGVVVKSESETVYITTENRPDIKGYEKAIIVEVPDAEYIKELQSVIEKHASDIEYIAMMSDIKL